MQHNTRQQHALLPAAVVLLWSVALVVTGLGVVNGVAGATGSGDFQWSGAHLLGHGVNAFDAVLHHRRAGLLLNQNPNYLHLLYFVLLPLGALPFSVARVVWVVANLAMAGGSALLLGRGVALRGWPLAGFVGLMFTSSPLVVAVGGGQQTLLVLFCSVLAFSAGPAASRGIAIAVAMTKYSFAPIGLVLLLRRRTTEIATAAALCAAAAVGYAVLTGSGLVATLLGPLQVSVDMARGSADVMTLSGYALHAHRAPATYGCAVACCLALLWWSRRLLAEGHWVDALAGGALISLLTFPHLMYDYCLLLPLLASAVRLPRRARWAVLTVVAVLWDSWLVGGWPLPLYQPLSVVIFAVLLLTALGLLVHTRTPRESTSAPAHQRDRVAFIDAAEDAA